MIHNTVDKGELPKMAAKTNKQFDPVKTLHEIEDKFEMVQILNEEGEIVNKDMDPKMNEMRISLS